jgi:hypothetical protein
MAVDSFYTFPAAQGYASVAPPNTAGVPNMGALSAPWTDLGGVTQDGLMENPSQSRNDFKRWGAISPYASVITDIKHEFNIKFLENNPAVLGLVYRTGTTPTASGAGTNEVQTITIAGTPTGGTFSLTFGGQTTPALAYNASTAAVQTALQALTSIGSGNATVSGTAGVSYVVTFVGALATLNVAQIVPVGTFTGGTSPTITAATTTGGSTGQLISITDDTTGVRDVRAMTFDIITGSGASQNHLRFYCPQAEVTAVANIPYRYDQPIVYDVTFTAYPDNTGVAVKRDFLLNAVVNGL